MDRKARTRLSDHELLVMHLFWEAGERRHEELEEAIEAIGHPRGEAMEIVRKLVERGVLDHQEEENTYIYSPLISRREVEELMLRDMIEHFYRGSREALLQGLVNHGFFTKEELAAAAEAVLPAQL